MRTSVLPPLMLPILLVAACTAGTAPRNESRELSQPPAFEESEPEAAPPPVAPEGGDAGGGDASSSGATTGTEPSTGSNIVVRGPDASLWRSKGNGEQESKEAIESCYRYALAQTRHDRQIIDDQDAAFDDSSFDPSLARIQREATDFGLKRRERRLIQECLEARGLTPVE